MAGPGDKGQDRAGRDSVQCPGFSTVHKTDMNMSGYEESCVSNPTETHGVAHSLKKTEK